MPNSPIQAGQSPTLEEPRDNPAVALPKIDGFELIEQIGRGGMGTVYRAIQRSTRREVAVKVFDATVGGPRARARFDREISLLARLSHPHIARIYESGISHGLLFFAMERIEGM